MFETEWVSVKKKLPKVNSANLFLVLIVGSTVPALAAFTGKHWKVQPPFAEWFVTRDGVTHWRKIA